MASNHEVLFEVIAAPAPGPHATHGRGDDSGPFDPDCPCRGGASAAECAEAGCGFCTEPEKPSTTLKPGYNHVEDVFVTGTGQVLTRLHKETHACYHFGCSIHNPTDPRTEWKTMWRNDRGLMERLCPTHGVGHPDLDHMNWVRRNFRADVAEAEGSHGCCGCCGPALAKR